jgi:multiple sugar transport system substrate-binding protein
MNRANMTIALLCCTAVLSAACSSAGKGEGQSPAPAEKPSDKPVELNVFYNSGAKEDEFNERWGNKIKQKFPNYTIRYIQKTNANTLTEFISSGNKIDLYIDSIGGVSTAGSLFDLSLQEDMTELARKHAVDLNRFEPSTLDSIKHFGGLYGIPIHTTSMVLYFNKDIFNKFGVPHLKDGMTWEQINDISARLTVKEGEKQYLGFATSPSHLYRMNQLSVPTIDVKTSHAAIENDRWKQLIETAILAPGKSAGYKSWVQQSGKIPPADAFVKDQNLAMYLYFVDWKTQNKAFETMNWDIVSAPTFKELPGVGAQTYPTYFSTTSSSQKKGEAMEVIKFITSDEQQLALSKLGIALPVLKSDEIRKVFGQESSFKGKNDQAVFYNKFAAPSVKTMYDAQVESQINKLLPKVVTEAMDLNTALRTAAEEANKAIDSMKKK